MMRPAASGNKPALTDEAVTVGEPELCIANIDAAGRRRRMTTGLVFFALTIAAVLFAGPLLDVSTTRLLLFALPLLYFAWLCVIQALDRT